MTRRMHYPVLLTGLALSAALFLTALYMQVNPPLDGSESSASTWFLLGFVLAVASIGAAYAHGGAHYRAWRIAQKQALVSQYAGKHSA